MHFIGQKIIKWVLLVSLRRFGLWQRLTRRGLPLEGPQDPAEQGGKPRGPWKPSATVHQQADYGCGSACLCLGGVNTGIRHERVTKTFCISDSPVRRQPERYKLPAPPSQGVYSLTRLPTWSLRLVEYLEAELVQTFSKCILSMIHDYFIF